MARHTKVRFEVAEIPVRVRLYLPVRRPAAYKDCQSRHEDQHERSYPGESENGQGFCLFVIGLFGCCKVTLPPLLDDVLQLDVLHGFLLRL